METPITKHPEFDKAFEAYATNQQLVEPFYGIACGDYAAGGEAAQAILQPEINRLRETNAELIKRIEELQNAVIDKIPDSMPVAKELYNASQIIQRAKRLQESPVFPTVTTLR